MKSIALAALLFVTALALGAGHSPVVFGAEPPTLPPQAKRPDVFVCPGAGPRAARCHSHVIVDGNGKPQTSGTPAGYGPVQFQTAYGVVTAAASPSTQTIGIVDAYDDPNAEKDLATYSRAFNLPPCTSANGCFTKVNQTGGITYPKSDSGWALEISLDVQTAHAICPYCKILLVEATSNSFDDLVVAEDWATHHATVVSNSWGASEFSGETGYDTHFNRPGVPITVSSGDNGYGVQYPAASQNVIAVGGTTLQLNSNNTRAMETAWQGTGSGCSGMEPKAIWQHDSGCPNRTVTDVAADADPNTGAAVYDSLAICSFGHAFCSSGWLQVGGTSLAAPIIAGLFALAGNGYSINNGSSLYANPLFDITSGSNGSCIVTYLCTAGSGYDGPTGNGAPNGLGGF